MDEEERLSKLKAGKEALLAYQQKKKKKSRSKKRTEPAAGDVDISTCSEPPSLVPGVNHGVRSLDTLSGNASLSPCDDFGHPSLEDNLSLPYDHSSRMSTSLPIVTNIHPAQGPSDSDRSSIPLTQYSDEPDGTVEKYDTPQPPIETSLPPRITELEQQMAALVESKQQLQIELNSVLDQKHQLQHEILQIRNNQDNTIDIAKREVATMFESQIASLQHSLMQSESAQQDLEKRLLNVEASHSQEIENLLGKQEEVRMVMLREKDQKHAEHVARLTEKFASQMETANGPQDSDEQEAERLKMIKLKMREMFDAEKKQMLAVHEQEKATIQQNTQKQLEDYRMQTEQLANAKLQEVHTQFMTAHQALLEQKNQSDALVQELSSKLEHFQQDQSHLLQEKAELQQRYDQLSESHLAELEKARHASTSLESRLDDWKEKAAKLEAHLHRSESESQTDLDNLREENTIALEKLKGSYEDRLKNLQQVADDYQCKLAHAESERDKISEEMRQARQELEVVRQKHSSEVDTLNQSIRELTQDKGSLEAAEEHMESVQKQLENYRKQELSFRNQLHEKEEDYKDGQETLRQQFEREKKLEIEQTAMKFKLQVKTLEEELASLTATVESGDAERKRHEKFESLRAKHKKRVSELESIHEQACKNLREQLERSHSKEINALNQSHTEEVAKLKDELGQQSKLEKALLVQEMEASKQNEIQRLTEEHKASLEQATKSLATEFSTKSNEHVSKLENELRASKEECSQFEVLHKDLLSQLELAQRQGHDLNQSLERTHREMERLSQDCDRYQKKSKSLEVDCSISKSAHEQDKQRLDCLQQEFSGLQTNNEELVAELEELRLSKSVSAQNEEMLTRLTNDLAAKNVTIADLQAQNDSLSAEVFSLTQKCQQLATKSTALQEQLDTSWGANEEIESLKQQVSELLPFREETARLKEKIEMLEEGLTSKDEAVITLESQLEQATQYVTETTTRCSTMDKVIAESSRELDLLRQRVAMKEGQEKELREMVGNREQQVDDLAAKNQENEILLRELNDTVKALKSQLGSASDRVNELEEFNTKLEEDLQCSQETLGVASNYKEQYERSQRDFERVCHEKDQLTVKLSTLAEQQEQTLLERSTSWQENVTKLEEDIRSLRVKLADKESELVQVRSEFGQKLREAELREMTLLQRKPGAIPSKEKLGGVVREKSALEETLIRARQVLTKKLAEKSNIEKELSLHRAELERRLSEKQRLEELLVEKSRFEHELQNQKEQLQCELEVIESKLKLKGGEPMEESSRKGSKNDRKNKEGIRSKPQQKIGTKTRHKKVVQ